jgi:hypothetical protein
MPLGQEMQPTPEDSLPLHVLPLPLPSSLPLGVDRRRPMFKTRVIPRSTAINAVKVKLSMALVAMVCGLL